MNATASPPGSPSTVGKEVEGIVKEMNRLVARLEGLCPGRKFTLDGHLVGSIGEAVARERYNLILAPSSTETHDAVTQDGWAVQIKTTQTGSMALSSEPDHLLVLFLSPSGELSEVYNGPGAPVWRKCGKVQKNGQARISLTTLNELQTKVLDNQRIRPTQKEKPDTPHV